MATIGRIAVDLVSRTAQFERDMKKARSTVSRFTASINSSLVRVAKFGSVTGGIAIAGLTKLTKDSLKNIDATAKWSDRIGISTKALSQYTLAANLAGVENQELFDTINKLSKNSGLAQTGEATQADAFEKIGISVEQLKGLDPDQLFQTVADKLQSIENPSQKTAIAMELMGRNGAKALTLIANGSKGLKASADEADRLGLSFSRIDAAKIEMANDAMTKLWGVFEGLGNTLAIQLSPVITTLADDFVSMATSGESSFSLVNDAVKPASKTIAFFAEGIEMIKMGWYVSKIALLEFMQELARFDPFTDMNNFTSHIKEANDALDGLLTKDSPLEAHEKFWKRVEVNSAKAANSIKNAVKETAKIEVPVSGGLMSGFEGTVKGIAAKSKSLMSGVSGFASNLSSEFSKGVLDSRLADVQSRIDKLNDMQFSSGASDNRAAVGVGEIFSSIQQQLRDNREAKKQFEQSQRLLKLEQEKKELQKQMLEALQKNAKINVVTI